MIVLTQRNAFWAATLSAGALACVLGLTSLVEAEEKGSVSFQEIEESLTCQCGCGLTVHSCNHLQCPSALPLRAEIREQMALGKSKQEILAHFGTKYGEKILSAPTVEGFNVLAWVTPFLLVAIGGAVVVITVKRWVKRQARTVAPQKPVPVASPYDDVLEKELKDFDA
jgi:cytochrome c-type biogenesis protein CcmH